MEPSNNGKITDDRTPLGTFAPGNKAGAGRPAGSRNNATKAMDAMLDGEAEAITRIAIEKAMEGDMTAIKLVFDRVCPAPKSRRVNIALPDTSDAAGIECAHAAVIQAVADGEISPDEGTALAGMLEARRKAVETHDFARRLAMIETAIAGKDEA
ncbi:MAG: hypothetical protein CMM78_04775 [Rhodospirillaceae bacterium]|nr:hypothetical protein [Rhodospirillales bacterium]MAX47501.1 hypothetical protein [Rhodospirillaceae bacterium]|tara:strand:+ start:29054 stop:29518 length:465 start_codon:yes stop_codon:yes gene_type:complete